MGDSGVGQGRVPDAVGGGWGSGALSLGQRRERYIARGEVGSLDQLGGTIVCGCERGAGGFDRLDPLRGEVHGHLAKWREGKAVSSASLERSLRPQRRGSFRPHSLDDDWGDERRQERVQCRKEVFPFGTAKTYRHARTRDQDIPQGDDAQIDILTLMC